MIRKNTSHSTPEIDSSLTIPTATGEAGITLPMSVIDNLRYLINRIQRDRAFPNRLALVAALRGEGVSYLSYALAATLANDLKARVCLVDLNWHWPFQSPLISAKNGGIAAVLNGDAALDDIFAPTGWENFSILPAGPADPRNATVYARNPALRSLLDQVGQRFDYLIYDIPAILASSDSVPLASLADACCLVIRQGVTGESDAKLALDEIKHLTVLGTVLNHAHFATPASWIEVLLGRI